MGVLKNVIEPGVIAFLFTVGTLVNRRKTSTKSVTSVLPYYSAQAGDGDTHEVKSKHLVHVSALRDSIFSRVLDKFPFLIEIWYWLLIYWVYQLARAFTASRIRGNEVVTITARNHAEQVLRFEQYLGIDIELSLNQLVTTKAPWLMPIFCAIYLSHIIVGVAFYVYAYTFFPAPIYRTIRRTLALDNALAFLILSIYRCAPPRLLPERGFVDVLHRQPAAGSTWSSNPYQLTVAAMPSLHFGTAMLIGFTAGRWSQHGPVRRLAWLWPVAMLVTIIVTANHWVLDAVVGALVPVVAYRLNKMILQ